MYSQIGGGGDWISSIIWFLMFFVFIFFYPRLMITQMVYKLEKDAVKFEGMSKKARENIIDTLKEKSKISKKQVKEDFDRIVEFFVVEPENADPAGIIEKIHQIIKTHDVRYENFVKQLVPDIDDVNLKNITSATVHATGVHQIAKIVRHLVELVKETKNLQIAMLLQMQMPFIEKEIKALLKSVDAYGNGYPVGDSIGPLCLAKFIGNSRPKKITKDVVYTKKKINGKDVFLMKSSGPGANLGEIDEAVEKIIKKNKISRIITIDASGKYKGEKAGSVAEGVGFAMGQRGMTEKFHIEELTTKKNIPLDAIGIKMEPEKAIMPMQEKVFKSIPKVREAVERSLGRLKKGEKALIIGVGITVGVGNDGKAYEKSSKIIKENIEKMKKEKKMKKENKGLKEKISDFLSPF